MIKINRKLCTGCRICEMICSLAHEGVINPKLSRIRILSDWPKEEKIQVCVACKSKNCIEACKEKALSWDATLILNEQKCNLCFACVEACSLKGIRLESSKKYPFFCDICGGNFECVKWCPPKAIVRMERNEK